MNFHCIAVGSETPVISWTHDGDNAELGRKYLVNSAPFRTEEGGRGLASTLTVLDVQAQDTGVVVCQVTTPPIREANNREFPGGTAPALLTVLGMWSSALVIHVSTLRDTEKCPQYRGVCISGCPH